MELRPRNLVEMFDLAVSLYGRNFLVLVSIVAVTAVPLALLQYPVTRMEQPQLDAAMRLLEHPEIAARQIPPAFNSPGALALSIALNLLGYLVWAFCLGAIAEGVARIYAATTIEFAACWQAVLRRWLSIVAVLSLAVLAMVVCDATAVALVTVFVSLAVVVAPSSLPIMAVGAMLLVLLTATLAPALLAMPCVFGFYGCTLESLGAVAALRVSFDVGSGTIDRHLRRTRCRCAHAPRTVCRPRSGSLLLRRPHSTRRFRPRIRFELRNGGRRGRRAGLCADGLSLGPRTRLGRAFSRAPKRFFGLAPGRARGAPCAARTPASTSRVARFRRRVAPGTTLKEVQGFLRSLPTSSRTIRNASALVRS
jgi:hypothetical protein